VLTRCDFCQKSAQPESHAQPAPLRRRTIGAPQPAGLSANLIGQPAAVSPKAPQPRSTDPTARSKEPILFPKLRIYFADFPYLHSSTKLEAFHLEHLMRFRVRPGGIVDIPSIFKGRRRRTGHHRKRCFTSHPTLSPVNPIPGSSELLKRKDNPFQGLRRRLEVRLRCRFERGSDGLHRQIRHAPRPGCGILTAFPFKGGATLLARYYGRPIAHFFTEFPYLLGPTYP